MSRRAIAHIDCSALQANLEHVRTLQPGRHIMAVIKSNGYGHGLLPVARALAAADGLAITRLSEANSLREAGIHQPLLLLEGCVDRDELRTAVELGLQVMLHSAYQIDQIEALQQEMGHFPLQVWVKVNTGMNRLGFEGADLPLVLSRLSRLPQVRCQVLVSHLACADTPEDPANQRQLEQFAELRNHWPGSTSLCNSAGLMAMPDAGDDWLRPGIMLYGVSPFTLPVTELPAPLRAKVEPLQPVMTLSAELLAVKPVQRGEAIGYGAQWVCERDSLVGIVGIGYADGYPRAATAATPTLVNGQRCRVLGRVSMGMICIDLSAQPQATPGTEVILWGKGLPVEEVAATMDRIPYELLTGVTGLVEHRYG